MKRTITELQKLVDEPSSHELSQREINKVTKYAALSAVLTGQKRSLQTREKLKITAKRNAVRRSKKDRIEFAKTGVEARRQRGIVTAFHGEAHPFFNTCWVYNKTISKRIHNSELNSYLSKGWFKGRKISKPRRKETLEKTSMALKKRAVELALKQKNELLDALALHLGNRSKAAKHLNISVKTLARRLASIGCRTLSKDQKIEESREVVALVNNECNGSNAEAHRRYGFSLTYIRRCFERVKQP